MRRKKGYKYLNKNLDGSLDCLYIVLNGLVLQLPPVRKFRIDASAKSEAGDLSVVLQILFFFFKAATCRRRRLYALSQGCSGGKGMQRT